MTDFRFADPEYFYLLILVLGLALASRAAANFAMRRLQLFSSNPKWKKYLEIAGPTDIDAPSVLTILAMVLLTVALARPQGDPIVEEREGNVLDIMVALDVSSSMAAEDVAPTRLGKAKHSIETMLDRLYGDRVGLIAFAGSAVLVSPLTSDYSIIRSFLDALNPSTISNQGTNFAAVANTAVAAFKRGAEKDPSAESRSHVIVIFSDGEATAGDFFETAKALKESGILVHTVAIGTDKGVPIPVRDSNGVLRGYKRDRMGNTVISKVNFEMLGKIAKEGGGKALVSSLAETEIQALTDSFRGLDRSTTASIKTRIYREYFYIPLALGFVLLCFVYIPWAYLLTRIGLGHRTMSVLLAALIPLAIPHAYAEEKSESIEYLPAPKSSDEKESNVAPGSISQVPGSNIGEKEHSSKPIPGYAENKTKLPKEPSTLDKMIYSKDHLESKKALGHMRAKSYDKSTKIYNRILADNPESEVAAFNSATNLAHQGKTEEAKALFQQLNDSIAKKYEDSSEAKRVDPIARFNSAGNSAIAKDTASAIQQYADLIKRLNTAPDKGPRNRQLMAQAKKNIEHLLVKQSGKDKLKQDEQKQNQKGDQKKEQQKQSGQGNKDDKNEQSKNKDQNKQNQDKKSDNANNQNQDQDQQNQQKKKDPSKNQKLSTKRKKFKKNEVLSERQARQILRSLRQHEGLLQKKFLRERSQRRSDEQEPEMDW